MKKKLLLLGIAFISMFIPTMAETLWFKAYEFAIASVSYGHYDWSDWETSTVKIKIDTTNDVIVIYSPATQIYSIYSAYNNGQAYIDSSGGKSLKFKVIDQDYDKGEARLRVDPSGGCQLYVDFSNVAWVYNIKRL